MKMFEVMRRLLFAVPLLSTVLITSSTTTALQSPIPFHSSDGGGLNSKGDFLPGADNIQKFSSRTIGSSQEQDLARLIRRQRSTRGKVEPFPTRDGTRKIKQKHPIEETERMRVNKNKKTSSIKQSNKNPLKPAKGHHIPYETTLSALQTYYSIHSHIVLPRKYIVPDDLKYPPEWHGIDLAGTVYDMKWWNEHVKQRPERVAELNKLKFVWERLVPEWNLILEALVTYRIHYGDLLVPTNFTVPYDEPEWPIATWGIALGRAVYRIRNRGDFIRGGSAWSRREQLDGIGFVWDIQEYRFEKFYSALCAFSKNEAPSDINGQFKVLRVPTRFVIPKNTDWPQDLWGYKLGEKCNHVRQKGLYIKNNPHRQRRLQEIGFMPSGNTSLGWLEVVHAAAIFSQLNNRNLDVPINFVVPAPPHHKEGRSSEIVGSDEAWPWPEHLWGFPLGQRLKDLRLKGHYIKGKKGESRRKQLDALGFVWKPKRGRKKAPIIC
jgi:hypothetical protein